MLFFLATGLVEAIWGLGQLYGFSYSQHSRFSLTGSFFNPGPYACYIAVVLPTAFFYALTFRLCYKVKFHLRNIPVYFLWGISLLTFVLSILVFPLGVGIGYFLGSYGHEQLAYFSTGKGTEREQHVAGNPEYGFNEYLQIAVEQGVVPFVLFMVITGYSIYMGIRRRRIAATASLMAMLIAATASYPVQCTSVPDRNGLSTSMGSFGKKRTRAGRRIRQQMLPFSNL
jgi:hypothetical protein